MRLDARGRELEEALSDANQALARVTAPEALADQILAKLGAVAARPETQVGTGAGRARKKRAVA